MEASYIIGDLKSFMNNQDAALKILMLEDSIADAELIKGLLNKERKQIDFKIAMDKRSFIRSLQSFGPDVILSDHSLPQFDSSEALKIARQWSKDIAFILVTGTVSEEYAAEMIKMGADDYILKDRMARLGTAITSAIERRKMLKESADYRYAMDQASIIAITDDKGIILYANDNFCKISKYEATELIGNDYQVLSSGCHSNMFMDVVWGTIAKGKIWRGEILNRAKDKSFYWVDMCIVPFLDAKGRPYQYLAIASDISERKKIERDLEVSNERFELVVTATNDVIWDWDFGTDTMWWNKNYFLNFGFISAGDILTRRSWRDHIHPDDAERVISGLEDCINSRRQSWTDEYRLIKNDGTVAHVLDYGCIVVSEGDEPCRMVGAMVDITARKMAEEELKRSNERFKLAALATSDLIWEMNFETKEYLIHEGEQKLFLNTKILSYEFGIGNEVIMEADLKRVSDSFRKAIGDPAVKLWQEEYSMETKDRIILHVANQAIFIRNVNGEAMKAIGAITDISEKQRLRDDHMEREKNEQISITATSLEAQEKERNYIGQELHENVNQILAGTNLYLSLIKTKPEKSQEYIDSSMRNIRSAIEENRKISRTLLTPNFKITYLFQLLFRLADSIFEISGINVCLQIEDFDEDFLRNNQKLIIYRIIQEQCANVVKLGEAHVVDILLSTINGLFTMKIQDDGGGIDEHMKFGGLGIRNVNARLSVFRGRAKLTGSPDKSYSLEVEMPILRSSIC